MSEGWDVVFSSPVVTGAVAVSSGVWKVAQSCTKEAPFSEMGVLRLFFAGFFCGMIVGAMLLIALFNEDKPKDSEMQPPEKYGGKDLMK